MIPLIVEVRNCQNIRLMFDEVDRSKDTSNESVAVVCGVLPLTKGKQRAGTLFIKLHGDNDRMWYQRLSKNDYSQLDMILTDHKSAVSDQAMQNLSYNMKDIEESLDFAQSCIRASITIVKDWQSTCTGDDSNQGPEHHDPSCETFHTWVWSPTQTYIANSLVERHGEEVQQWKTQLFWCLSLRLACYLFLNSSQILSMLSRGQSSQVACGSGHWPGLSWRCWSQLVDRSIHL